MNRAEVIRNTLDKIQNDSTIEEKERQKTIQYVTQIFAQEQFGEAGYFPNKSNKGNIMLKRTTKNKSNIGGLNKKSLIGEIYVFLQRINLFDRTEFCGYWVTEKTKGDAKKMLVALTDNKLGDFKSLMQDFQTSFCISSLFKDRFRLVHLAVLLGRENFVKYLLQKNTDFSVKAEHGLTPLHIATMMGFTGIFKQISNSPGKFLQDSISVLINGKNVSCTALHLAVYSNRIDIVEVILNKYQSKNLPITAIGKMNLLHFAVLVDHKSMLHYLLYHEKCKDFLQSENESHMTPLALAASLGNFDAVSIFLKHPTININHYSKKHEMTALHFAVQYGQHHIVEYLIYNQAELKGANANCGHIVESLGKISTNPLNLAEALLSRYEEGDDNWLKCSRIVGMLKVDSEISKRTKPNYHKLPIKNLVFKGGGVKGVAYVGAFKKLRKIKGIGNIRNVERAGGTSAGSIMAMLVALGCAPREIEDFFDGLKFQNFLKGYKIPKGNITKVFQAANFLIKSIRPTNSKNLLEKIKNKFSISADVGTSGELFRETLAELIKRKTEDKNFTFGELRKFIESGNTTFKHLYVVTTCVSHNKIMIINSEDTLYDNIIIADAVRASASFPFVFKPHMLHVKSEDKRIEDPHKRLCIDGGVVRNYPLDLFDTLKFIDKYDDGHPDYKMINRHTLGFCLYNAAEPKNPEPKNIKKGYQLAKAIVDIYYRVEDLLNKDNKCDMYRTIKIDNCGVGALEVDISEEMKKKLKDSGEQAVQDKFQENTYSSGMQYFSKFKKVTNENKENEPEDTVDKILKKNLAFL